MSDLDDRLFKKYPDLLRQLKKSGSYMSYGIMCDSGWEFLLDTLFQHIQTYVNRNKLPQPEIGGIKEKWGNLVIFIDVEDDLIRGMVSHTMFLSRFYCEECGTTKNVGTTTKGWLRVRCINCVRDIKQTGWKQND